MGKVALLLLALVLSTVATARCNADEFRITADDGGRMGEYAFRYAALRDNGTKVVIDGRCLSACTLVFGFIPAERLCATPRAVLGFHAAWDADAYGRMVTNERATDLLFTAYPQSLRFWINHSGGLTERMRYLRAPAVFRFIAPCA